jgi:beta-1,4-mannosyl-glycoprotein beta-1,4-N-acetylglucosaminyltransferase
MLIDVFNFSYEKDVLEIRLNTLAGVVDKFVIVESLETFAGEPKESEFLKIKNQFKDFPIEHVLVELPDCFTWGREWWQGNYGYYQAKQLAGEGDWLFVGGGVDEIPNPEVLKSLLKYKRKISTLMLRQYEFKLNYQIVNAPDIDRVEGNPVIDTTEGKPWWWVGGCLMPIEECPQIFWGPKSQWELRLEEDREDNAGWHYSKVLPTQDIQRILRGYSHADEFHHLTIEELDAAIKEKRHLRALIGQNLGKEIKQIEIKEPDAPKYLVENQAKYAHLIG